MKFSTAVSVAAVAAVASAEVNSTATAVATSVVVATSVEVITITSCSDHKCFETTVPVTTAPVSTAVPTAPVFTTSYSNFTNCTTPTYSSKGNNTSTAVVTGAGARVAGSMFGAVALGAAALLI